MTRANTESAQSFGEESNYVLPPATNLTRAYIVAPTVVSVKTAEVLGGLSPRGVAIGFEPHSKLAANFPIIRKSGRVQTGLQILQNQWLPCDTCEVAAYWGADVPIEVGRKIAGLAVTKKRRIIDA